MTWKVEKIPNEARLFYRIHKTDIVDGQIVPGAFRERGEGESKGMSVDWEEYSSAKQLLERSKVPDDNGIGHFVAQEVRVMEDEDLIVYHCPVLDNRSHSHIKGIPKGKSLKTKVRAKLLAMFKYWDIEPLNKK